MINEEVNRRVLIIDDNESVHEDFRKILVGGMPQTPALDLLAQELFGEVPEERISVGFDLESAYQGAEGLDRVRRAVAEGRPHAMAFVDVRMPPGWDGIETVGRIWEEYPDIQVVICSAYSDYSWEQTVAALGQTDRLVILRKPFENIEVRQLAAALTAKWALERRVRARIDDLEEAVRIRTRDLEVANEKLREEMVRRERMEAELRSAHKLEAMGRLAAGIAHEINSPMQFVKSNMDFVAQSVADLLPLVETARAYGLSPEPAAAAALADRLGSTDQIEYLARELPAALTDADAGIDRVSKIISSMKSLTHPGQSTLAPVDVNQALREAITICHGAIRKHAEVVEEMGEVPPVLASPPDLGRAFVNLIVNAVDAIGDAVEVRGRRGVLRVCTRVEGKSVVTSIEDDGVGIPEDIREKIFEPFFTTKEVGRGTGQGLAIARSIVVDQFGGALGFETEIGKGTTFHVRLPISNFGVGEVAA